MIHYNTYGSGESLVLIHGALVSQAMWQPQIGAFAKKFQVVTLDLPAHGRTPDLKGEYSVGTLADFVVKLLDDLDIHQSHVCGHSLGGMVAQQLAFTHPERVHKLVLAETAFSTQNSFAEQIQTRFSKVFLRAAPQTMLVDLTAKQYGSLNSHVGKFVRDEMNHYDHKTSLRVMSAAFGYDGKTWLKQIKSPTLVLVAENNIQTHSQGKEMAELIPIAMLRVIKKAHHLMNMDNPDDFNREVIDFLHSEV